MTGFDVVLIVVLIGFALLGLKHGSVWIASCLVGGFIGAFLVEYYAMPVAELMGSFMGAQLLASLFLFGVGVLIAIIPGWIASRAAGMFCVGAFDKILGIVVGLVAGLIAVTLAFMILMPKFPSMERSQSWRHSSLARPLCDSLEDFFSHPSKKRVNMTDEIKEAIDQKVSPVLEKTSKTIDKTADTIKTTANEAEHTVTKRAKAVKKAVTGEK